MDPTTLKLVRAVAAPNYDRELRLMTETVAALQEQLERIRKATAALEALAEAKRPKLTVFCEPPEDDDGSRATG